MGLREPSYLPPPPPSPLESFAAPGASRASGGEGGGGGGEDRGINGPPFFPSSLGTSRIKSAEGRGLEGAGDHLPIPNSPLRPYPPPSLPRTKAQKSVKKKGSSDFFFL